MAATYTNVPLSVPSNQRSMLITNVVAGDRIDVSAILGRAANKVQIIPDSATDSISYRFNSLQHLKTTQDYNFEIERTPGQVDVWSSSPRYSVYNSVGSASYETVDGLQVTSIEVTAIVFGGTGTSIEIVVS